MAIIFVNKLNLLLTHTVVKKYYVSRDVNVFIFFEKQLFSLENDDKKLKTKPLFYQKVHLLKMFVFIKIVIL